MRRYTSALLLMLSLAGCAGLVDNHYEHTQKLRTELAYLKFWWTCDDACGSDYKAGWKAGYLDVTTGGNGTPPMFAPSCYWSPGQITKHHDQNRHEWYVGFQDGAMLASLQPDTHYLKVWNPPPAYHVPSYFETERSSILSEPNSAPPSDSQDLAPTPSAEPEILPPELPGNELPAGRLNDGNGQPPVPERPMPAQ